MTTPAFEDGPPDSPQLTRYDECHFVTYIRLLDAEAAGADWREVVELIFSLDPAQDPVRAKAVHANHLARARWMTEAGYRHLLAQPQP